MTTVTKFTPKTCETIGQDIIQALSEVKEKWGIDIVITGGTYTNDTFSTKLKVSLAGVDVEKKIWDRYCHRFGLTPEQYGTTFKYGGDKYTACGIKPKGKKYPVLGSDITGKRYKFPASVLSGLD